MEERRIETNRERELLSAADRVTGVDGLRSTDNQRFRNRVQALLDLSGKSLKTPEGFDTLEKAVTGQHEQRVEILKRGGLYEGVAIPGVQESIDILGQTLTEEQVKAVLGMQKDCFVIEPGKPFTEYVGAIDRNKRRGQIDTYFSPYLQKRFAGMPVGGVRVGFVEGKAELAGDPNLVGKKLKEQERLFKAGLATGVEQIHPRTDALLQLDGMKTDQLVDVSTWSPLEDNSTERTYLPGGFWSNPRVYFRGSNPGVEFHFARWRSAVMVSAN